jgi:putative transposase
MACLSTDMDRNVFLKYLREAMAGADFHLHAFVLMTNHVHLLATGHRKGAVADVMHSVGHRYARYFNRYFDRTGPVFQGRYWSSIIETEGYFFRTMRYIELNPIRAGMVDRPERFPWSSHGHNTGRERREELTFHEQYLRLGGTPADRASAWADVVAQGMSQDELDCIRKRFRRNRPWGSAAFEKDVGDGSLYPSPIPVPKIIS